MKRRYVLAAALLALLIRLPALAAEPQAKPAAPERARLSQYAPFGLTSEAGRLYYEGERVRYFFDGYEIEEGAFSVHYEYVDAEGAVDVRAVRSVLQNEDGSVNYFGELTAIVPYSEAEFARRDLNALLAPPLAGCTAAETAEDGKTVLSSGDCLAQAVLLEQADAKIFKESESGLEIPARAVYTVGEETGVYVVSGSSARWRPVTILRMEQDKAIVQPNAGLSPGDRVRLEG